MEASWAGEGAGGGVPERGESAIMERGLELKEFLEGKWMRVQAEEFLDGGRRVEGVVEMFLDEESWRVKIKAGEGGLGIG